MKIPPSFLLLIVTASRRRRAPVGPHSLMGNGIASIPFPVHEIARCREEISPQPWFTRHGNNVRSVYERRDVLGGYNNPSSTSSLCFMPLPTKQIAEAFFGAPTSSFSPQTSH